MIAPVLRPLTIGEIFDRAVTIYVQNFALFSLILLTVLVPTGFAHYLSVGNSAVASYQHDIQSIEHPGAIRRPQPSAFPRSRVQNAGTILDLLILFAALPVATNAIAIAVGMLSAGRRPSFSICVAQAIRRWPRLLATICIFWLIFAIALFGGSIVLLLLLVIGISLKATAFPVAVALFIAAAVAFAAFCVFLMMLLLVGSVAFISEGIESERATSAIASGLQRILGKTECSRAILMSLAFIAIQIGMFVVAEAIYAWIMLILKLPALGIVSITLVNVLLIGFVSTVMAVYYYDIRVRQEGFDLEADLGRLGADAHKVVA